MVSEIPEVPLGPESHPVAFQNRQTLRPRSKMLPEFTRAHNRSLVLQRLYRRGEMTRTDIARETGLTRVTVAGLILELIDENVVVETGKSGYDRPGKPAVLVAFDHQAYQVIGIDVSGHSSFTGVLLDLEGTVIAREGIEHHGATGDAAVDLLVSLIGRLRDRATAPVLGIGVGTPGVVSPEGTVVTSANLGWENVPLQSLLKEKFDVPVHVDNDANTALLAEHTYGDAARDAMLIMIGSGVGSAVLLDGVLLHGSTGAAGEIGHVIVGEAGGAECACGKRGCLETWLAVPYLQSALDADPLGRNYTLTSAGKHLGMALAQIIAALNLPEVILSGPEDLLGGVLLQATRDTVSSRTKSEFQSDLSIRLTDQGDDIIAIGATVLVVSQQLGVS